MIKYIVKLSRVYEVEAENRIAAMDEARMELQFQIKISLSKNNSIPKFIADVCINETAGFKLKKH